MAGTKAPETISREDIDRVVAGLTMGDMQAAFEAGVPDKALAGVAFRRAAKRLGVVNGAADALDYVAAGDVRYLGEVMQTAMSDRNPLSPGGKESPASADTGA